MTKRRVGFNEQDSVIHSVDETAESSPSDLDLDPVKKHRHQIIKDIFSSGSSEEGEYKGGFNEDGLPENIGGASVSSGNRAKKGKDELSEWTRVDNPQAQLYFDEGLNNGFGDSKDGGEEIPIEPFSLREELEEGKFDEETGDYLRKRDENQNKDGWLAGVNRQVVERARRAQMEREKRLASASPRVISEIEAIGALVGFMELGENVMEALQRRSPPKSMAGRRKFDRKSQRTLTDSLSEEMTLEQVAGMEQKRKEIEQITEMATILLEQYNVLDIYEKGKEELIRLLK